MTSARQLSVAYFDGLTARAQPVLMWVEPGMLQLSGAGLIRQVPLNKVQWSERTRHGARMAHFADGGTIQAVNPADWDSWLDHHDLGAPLSVRAHQSWRWTMLATTVLLMVAVMGYWWGLPLAARLLAPLVPQTVSQQIGKATLQTMDEQWLKPSQLPFQEQAHWRALLSKAIAQGLEGTEIDTGTRAASRQPAIQLQFRQAHIGPNAFALPDGNIVITDDLIALLHDREDVLIGVVGHETGHITGRHGLRGLIQAGLLGAIGSLTFGDFSTVLASAPILMGQLAYSRDLEREADDAAITFMHRNHIRPSVMGVFFQRVKDASPRRGQATAPQADDASQPIGIAFSSHPADAERLAHFQSADLDGGLQEQPTPP
ncbi:M48 family metallopeptidase [Aquabacterium sp. NJ1]|uniref:M48 family metallopeptidase n=1 Tax=Aquabacterium sp. NJ1 TaxID=1538295 RepID=UPI00068F3930|nr:M48 family metallopeptidase [Aquabacterium sp. NJ1]